MPVSRFLAAILCCAITAPACLGQVTDFTNWDFYRDPSDPSVNAAMTGSLAMNNAALNFINDVDIPAAYDIGHSSVNANTVPAATTGYYFSASQDFTIALNFELLLNSPDGFIAVGMGIGEDRAGSNSAGITLGVGTVAGNISHAYAATARNNDATVIKTLSNPGYTAGPINLSGSKFFGGSMTIAYDASTGNITVGAGQISGTELPSPPETSATFLASDLPGWNGDDLLVSLFLRSDSLNITTPIPMTIGPWTGNTAQAQFFDFTILEGSPTQVPEPTSLALLSLASLAFTRHPPGEGVRGLG